MLSLREVGSQAKAVSLVGWKTWLECVATGPGLATPALEDEWRNKGWSKSWGKPEDLLF